MRLIWKKDNFYTRKLRKNSELQVRIKLTTLWVLFCTLQPLSYRRLYGEQGRNFIIITTPVIEDCIRDFLEISCPPAYDGNYHDMTVKNWKDDVLRPSPCHNRWPLIKGPCYWLFNRPQPFTFLCSTSSHMWESCTVYIKRSLKTHLMPIWPISGKLYFWAHAFYGYYCAYMNRKIQNLLRRHAKCSGSCVYSGPSINARIDEYHTWIKMTC